MPNNDNSPSAERPIGLACTLEGATTAQLAAYDAFRNIRASENATSREAYLRWSIDQQANTLAERLKQDLGLETTPAVIEILNLAEAVRSSLENMLSVFSSAESDSPSDNYSESPNFTVKPLFREIELLYRYQSESKIPNPYTLSRLKDSPEALAKYRSEVQESNREDELNDKSTTHVEIDYYPYLRRVLEISNQPGSRRIGVLPSVALAICELQHRVVKVEDGAFISLKDFLVKNFSKLESSEDLESEVGDIVAIVSSKFELDPRTSFSRWRMEYLRARREATLYHIDTERRIVKFFMECQPIEEQSERAVRKRVSSIIKRRQGVLGDLTQQINDDSADTTDFSSSLSDRHRLVVDSLRLSLDAALYLQLVIRKNKAWIAKQYPGYSD